MARKMKMHVEAGVPDRGTGSTADRAPVCRQGSETWGGWMHLRVTTGAGGRYKGCAVGLQGGKAELKACT